jgi:hypothetical protein
MLGRSLGSRKQHRRLLRLVLEAGARGPGRLLAAQSIVIVCRWRVRPCVTISLLLPSPMLRRGQQQLRLSAPADGGNVCKGVAEGSPQEIVSPISALLGEKLSLLWPAIGLPLSSH